MSEVLAYIVIAGWLMAEGYSLADPNMPPRPIPYRILASVFTVAAVWLAWRTVL